MHTLPNDAFVMLDPAVEVLQDEIDEYRLLCHSHFEVGMAVPPGESLLEFVTRLRGNPVSVKALRAEFDDQELIDSLLASLSQRGFVHVTSKSMPTITELAHLRSTAEQSCKKTLRRHVFIDLDVSGSIEHVLLCLAQEIAPEVLLRCKRLAEHKGLLAELARLRQARAVRMHNTVVQTTDLACDREIYQSLIRLGASVNLEGLPWPAPDCLISGLAEMTGNCIPVHAVIAPDFSIFDKVARDRAIEWAGSVFISGLRLRLNVDSLWSADGVTEDEFICVFNAVRALEHEFGDVAIISLPSDEVLLGNAASSLDHTQLSDLANRFRKAYLRWRIPFLKSYEADNTWSQIPEVEEKVVRSHEDLLPNHPDLLLLRPGSIVVDVCGGIGRVARRLAPAVGHDGLIVSIEMLRHLSDRARHFACEKNLTNLQFRTGLAQRIPLPDAVADAVVNEWTGGIWELGLGPKMVKEMTRVVRPGGRIAVTHRLVQIPLTKLGQPWIQYDEIYDWMHDAFVHPELTIITERVWGQIVPSLVGENATHWRKQYIPRLINPHNYIYEHDEQSGVRADVFLTIIAQRCQ